MENDHAEGGDSDGKDSSIRRIMLKVGIVMVKTGLYKENNHAEGRDSDGEDSSIRRRIMLRVGILMKTAL